MEVSALHIKCSNHVFRPTFFKDVAGYVKSYDQRQRMENIPNDMTCHCITSWRSKYFDVWGIDFMRNNFKFLLVSMG